ncbi:guanine deaminase [Nordella sp. HKS 07]|uniref:guanine deaminase n=1 Tax=Nordella sp. HKS 07 TaxID=2712222 RepID=UPI0013E12509|nr:guanine deaminase [Nordella sp. HKS 07]QIG49684.1 guanine deaminase [Nordella sp. HKS 07]
MTRIVTGMLLTFGASAADYLHEPQGAVVIGDDGRILWRGARQALPEAWRAAPVDDHGDCLILPGFIDVHIHFPQYRMLAAPGKDLLDWLSRFTFPEEARYGDVSYAEAAAEKFLDRLIVNGTTSAMVFSSVHNQCAGALFAAALKRRMAILTGKTMMDRDVPQAVRDTAEAGGRDSEVLYQTWHRRDRLRYVVSPRFAVTSSEAQLRVSAELMQALPDALMQTHLSESQGELARIRELYPNDTDYTDVYDRFGLLGERSVFAHGIHLSERECKRLSETGSSVAHCPTSNMFLGSGLMSMAHLGKPPRPVGLGLGTDVGGGTSYSMLATMGAAYKVQMLTGYRPTALELFHMATRRNAEVLRLADEVGSLDSGKWADIVVIDPKATDVLASRQELSQSLEDMLFALAILGDDRAIRATYVAGRKIHERRVT